ncbi:hypothetical protein PG991_009537 [Apiospora marii]|uniref:Uncharacterized protein n=1 Tax=Apiospora marii TaxID=335849 RepID=A0ABR1RK85_9PEZI
MASPVASPPPSLTESSISDEELEQLSTESDLRKLISDRLPTAESPPNYVRIWMGGYFTYRGVDPDCADRFFWSGAEFTDLDIVELTQAFRAKLMIQTYGTASVVGLMEQEVEMMAIDVFQFIQMGKTPPRNQMLARLMRLFSSDATMQERLNGFLVLVGLLLLVLLALYARLVYLDFDEAVTGPLWQAWKRKKGVSWPS